MSNVKKISEHVSLWKAMDKWSHEQQMWSMLRALIVIGILIALGVGSVALGMLWIGAI